MADTNWFEITEGLFALAVIDTGASGYSTTWQAPSGLTADTVAPSSYAMPAGTSWQCQLTSGKLTPKSTTKTRDRAATWCNPASTATTPVSSSWTLDVEIAQDPHIVLGLSRFLFEHDAEEAYFMLGLAANGPPTAIGRVYLAAGDFGGTAGDDLTAKVSMLLSRKPSIDYGDNTTDEVVD